jgi:serralysin
MRYKHDIIPDQQFDTPGRAAAAFVGRSGVALADGVLSGYEWAGSTISYSFPDSKRDYGYKSEPNSGFSPVNKKIQNAVERTLDQAFGNAANDGFSVEGFTNLTIKKGSHTRADLRFAESSQANPTAYAYYPADGQKGIGGDVWFGKARIYDNPIVGNYAYATILHEIGHALGLKHGHAAQSFDRIKTTLQGKYDSHEYSVMTYHSHPNQKGDGYSNEMMGYPQTYMMADIRALQHMYGADFTTNSGDTVYSWSPKNGKTMVDGVAAINPGANRIFATIWDGGGEDTYDLSAYLANLKIDLRPGQFSVFKASQLADLNQSQANRSASGNIYNALRYEGDGRSLIENAIGGSGNDVLRGNAAANILTGNGGNDTFIFRMGGGSDTITDFTAGDRINLKTMGLSFADILAMGTDTAGGFRIDFGNGRDYLTLQGRQEDDLSASDFML